MKAIIDINVIMDWLFIKDYEDAVIEQSALINECDLIITRNTKDFENGKVQSIAPKEFLRLFADK